MSGIKRVIAHWAVTRYLATGLSKHHYHYVVEGDGTVITGQFSPEDNIRPVKGKYAAHTLNCNTGSIGISCAAMYGATSETSYGNYPITHEQLLSMCKKIAELCLKYDIPVTPRTVLSHAEVQETLGIKQRGKWDIATLPLHSKRGSKECGDYIRKLVSSYVASIRNQERVALEAPKPRAVIVTKDKPKPSVTPTKVAVGTGIVGGVSVLTIFWDRISNFFTGWF